MAEEGNVRLGWHMTGSAGEVADVLMQFAQELRQGMVSVWKGPREIHLDPTGQISLDVTGTTTDEGREGLQILLYWTTQDAAADALRVGTEVSPPDEPLPM